MIKIAASAMSQAEKVVHWNGAKSLAAFLPSALVLVSPLQARSETYPIQGGVNWVLVPEAIPAVRAPSEAKIGDFLFVQPLVASAEAVAQQGSLANIPFPFLGSIAKSLDGERLALVTGGTAGPVFCSIDFIKNKGQRICLADASRSSVFNYQTRAYGARGGEPFSGMMTAVGVPANIAYRVETGPRTPLMYGGLVVKRTGNGFRLMFAVSEKGRARILEQFEGENPYFSKKVDVANLRFTASQLPARIGIFGAIVEISAIDGNVVRYGVVSTFSSQEPIIVSRAGSLPVAP